MFLVFLVCLVSVVPWIPLGLLEQLDLVRYPRSAWYLDHSFQSKAPYRHLLFLELAASHPQDAGNISMGRFTVSPGSEAGGVH